MTHNFPPPWNQQLLPSLTAWAPETQILTLWLLHRLLSWPMMPTQGMRFPVWLLSHPILVGDHATMTDPE